VVTPRLQLHIVGWALAGGLIALLTRTMFGVTMGQALAFALPLSLLAVPVSLSAWYLCRAMPISRTNVWWVAFSAIAAAVVASSIWAAIGRTWWGALSGLGLPPAPGTPLVTLLAGFGGMAYLMSVTVHYTVQAVEGAADLAKRELQSQIAAREAELRALRAQVDPHFLFNSLNAISGLIAPQPERAREMTRRLADFLRESLTLGAVPRISLARELALTEQYLEIERVRFGDRLRVQITSSADGQAAVPPLLLQPLAENAVRHGIATCLDGGLVEINVETRGPLIWLTVTNPRDPDGGRRGTGFGMDIVRRRLHAAFGDRAALAVEPSEEAYRVSLTWPIELRMED
jgi:two-component system sensor histidine kinase AlgZ